MKEKESCIGRDGKVKLSEKGKKEGIFLAITQN